MPFIFKFALFLAFLAVGFQLTEIHSPDIDYSEFPGSKCDGFSSCGKCTNDGDCGYCYMNEGGGAGLDNVNNGSCVEISEWVLYLTIEFGEKSNYFFINCIVMMKIILRRAGVANHHHQ